MTHPTARSTARSRRRLVGDAGSVTTLVLVFPVLLMMIMLIIQFAVAWHAKAIATAAAQDAVAVAQLDNNTPAEAETTAVAFIDDYAATILQDLTVTATETPGSIIVEVAGTATSVIPGWNLAVTGRAAGPRETFQPTP